MEDSVLERIIHDDRVPRSPREQLARNLKVAELVFEGAYEAIVRVYRFTPGVILGLNQSIDDVDRDACAELGYEVVRRPTAGDAVIVDPEQALCYSFFFPSGAMRPWPAPLYQGIVIPFAERLASGVIVDRFFSLIPPGSEYPIAGHAMAHHHYNAVTQIDGIIHASDPDIGLFSSLLKLRELYLNADTPIIRRGDSYYSKAGRLMDPPETTLVVQRSEHDEISRFLGFRSLGIADSHVLKALFDAAEHRFGPLAHTDLDYGDVVRHLETVDSETLMQKNYSARGHCFIDF